MYLSSKAPVVTAEELEIVVDARNSCDSVSTSPSARTSRLFVGCQRRKKGALQIAKRLQNVMFMCFPCSFAFLLSPKTSRIPPFLTRRRYFMPRQMKRILNQFSYPLILAFRNGSNDKPVFSLSRAGYPLRELKFIRLAEQSGRRSLGKPQNFHNVFAPEYLFFSEFLIHPYDIGFGFRRRRLSVENF